MLTFRRPTVSFLALPVLTLALTSCSAFALDPPSRDSLNSARDAGDQTSATTKAVSPTQDVASTGMVGTGQTTPDNTAQNDTDSPNATNHHPDDSDDDGSSGAPFDPGATDHDASMPGLPTDVTSGTPDDSDTPTHDGSNGSDHGTSFHEWPTQDSSLQWTDATGNTNSSTLPPDPDESTVTSEPTTSTTSTTSTTTTDPTSSTTTDPTSSTTTDPTSTSSNTSSTSDPTTTSGGDPSTSDEPPQPAACDPLVTTNAGIHVSPAGTNSAYCGASHSPCQTVSYGTARAPQVGANIVYLAQGTYAESVTLSTPISLIGGWTPSSGAWTRPCQSLATTTTIASPEAIGLSAQFSGTAELESLQIRTKGRDGTDGSSRYGIFATGSATRLELRDLVVAPGSANPGASGVTGQNGSPPPSSCETGDGADGAPATVAPSTSPGVFTQAGFVPGDGANGSNGNSGQNGALGANVEEVCDFCTNCIGAAGGERIAQGGANGCGGGHGMAGGGGSGGGSSVGVFAALANVYFGDSVVVSTGSGGDGAVGGHGGDGVHGSYGSEGTDYVCNPQSSGCNNSCDKVIQSNYGGDGGNGSPGSAGGDGAGGWSVTLVGTSGAFSGSGITPILGQAGTSQGSGPDGTSQFNVTIN